MYTIYSDVFIEQINFCALYISVQIKKIYMINSYILINFCDAMIFNSRAVSVPVCICPYSVSWGNSASMYILM